MLADTPFTLKAVLFDLDGTLLDTFPAIIGGWNAAMLPLAGRTYSAKEVLDRFGPHDEKMLANELVSFPTANLAQTIEAYYSGYERSHGEVTVFPGIEELVSGVSALGLPLGLMTGKSQRALEITLRQVGWEGRFVSRVTGTEISAPKPSPEGVLKVAAMLGVDPANCIYIGDMPADVGAARSAGMKAIAALWNPYFAEPVRALNPDFIAEEPAEVLAYIQGLLDRS